MYDENSTMKFVGQQSIGVVPPDAKDKIYDVATVYSQKGNIGLSELLRMGTDVFILGYFYGKGDL